jgi:hypothetical protein
MMLAASVSSALGDVLVPGNGSWVGVYANPKSGESNWSAVTNFEKLIGRKVRIVNKYHSWSNHSYDFERDALKAGKIVMISWRGTDSGTDSGRAKKISSGQYDSLIRTTADAVKALPGRVLIRFNWEMDQDPGQRQHIGTPSEFIAAWKHVVGIFRGKGVNNAEFVWAPRARSFSKGIGQSFWPGSSYVDWIGGSAVPVDSWDSFSTIFSGFYSWGSKQSAPLLVWIGVREKPGDSGWKAGFINGMKSNIKGWPRVKAMIYYHALAPKGNAYWVNTSSQALSAFKSLAGDSWFQPNGRRIKL